MTGLRKGQASLLFIALLLSGLLPAIQISAVAAQSLDEFDLAQMEQDVRISYHSGTGKVRYIGSDPERPIAQPLRLPIPLSTEQAAREFLTAYGPLFGLTDQATELILQRQSHAPKNRSFVRFQQMHQSVPIFGGELVVQLNSSRDLISLHGEILPDIDLDIEPNIDAATATQTALQATAKWHGLEADALAPSVPELWIYNPVLVGPRGNTAMLVWRIEITARELLPIRELVLVDAHRNSIALHFNQIHTARDRKTYTANHTATLPGTLVCDESNPTCTDGSADAIAAHLNAGFTYDFFFDQHGRDSIDNAGKTIHSTVEYCPNVLNCPYNNAFWNGQQMVYGDGFPVADDVVAHEIAHGVTEFESQLFYYYQSGAINESLSDLWGEFVDLTNGYGNDSPEVRWQIGEDIPGFGAIRDMSDPTEFGDPDRVTSKHYYLGELDFGGVHTNSGINNKAIALMTDGGTFNGYVVSGLGILKVAAIYYEVQTNLAVSGSDYADLYDMLYQSCLNLVGTNDIILADCQQVLNAVSAVEMNLQPVAGYNEDVSPCAADEAVSTIFFDGLEDGSANWSFGATVGTSRWRHDSPYGSFAHTGQHLLYADDFPGQQADTFAAIISDLALPDGAYLHFAHAYGFEGPNYDGGVVEYSTDGGATWHDAGALFDFNGYDGAINSNWQNPLSGRQAFLSDSHGYISSRLNLDILAGESVRFHWRMGLDTTGYDWGWWLDDVHVYTCVPPATHTITVTKIGDGTGNVTSQPAGIDCGVDCAHGFTIGTALSLTVVSDPSSTFSGWSGACAGSDPTCNLSVDDDMMIEAAFDLVCFALSLSHIGDGFDPLATPTNSDSCDPGQYVAGESIQLTASPSTDWHVSGWAGTDNDESSANNNAVTMPASSHSVSVTYEEIPAACFELGLSHSGNGSDPTASPTNSDGCDPGHYVAGQVITLTASPSIGWRVSGWAGTDNNASTATNNLVTMPASDHSVGVTYVELPPTCYELSITHSGNGSDPSTTPANSAGCELGHFIAGDSLEFTAAPSNSWRVSGWSGTDNDTSTALTNTATMPAADHSVSVIYEEIPHVCYALSVSHSGNGADPVAAPANSDGCEPEHYVAGQIISLTASPATGWRVGSWSGTNDNASAATTNTATMPAANHSVAVTYAEIPLLCYQLNVSHSGDGSDPLAKPANSGGCEPGHYVAGQIISLTASPAVGWQVINWSGTDDNASASINNSATMPASNHAVHVTYEEFPPLCYQLSVSHSGNGSDPLAKPANSGGCEPAHYMAGQVISLAASPDSGWQVSSWTGTDNNVNTAVTNTVTMPRSNHAIHVTYEEIPPLCYQLSVSHSGDGSDPLATPANSDGCDPGRYIAGQSIQLSASPSSGWRVGSWSGTNNNISTAITSSTTMPSADHTVGVNYEEIPAVCFELTVTHTGNGSDPLATSANSDGCASGQYVAGEVITLTANPNSGWQVSSWSGTDQDASTAAINSTTMPAANHNVSVTYVEIPPLCFALSMDHSGDGSDPLATPVNSNGCASGQYVAGEVITLIASPNSGWQVSSWSGTDDDTTTVVTNSVTMPASSHSVQVAYEEIPTNSMTAETSTMYFGEQISLNDHVAFHVTAVAKTFDLVVIPDLAPDNLILRGVAGQVPYTGRASMLALTNHLLTLDCTDATPCNKVRRTIFDASGHSNLEEIVTLELMIYMPLIRR